MEPADGPAGAADHVADSWTDVRGGEEKTPDPNLTPSCKKSELKVDHKFKHKIKGFEKK